MTFKARTLLPALARGTALLALAAGLAAAPAPATRADDSHPLAGLKLRNIGPALTSGRISDFAMVPGAPHRYFVAVASGNLWKTDNAGTTWSPIFDNHGSYALGVVELAPGNPDIVWLGTGENNAQRSVGYGDGVYRSLDGGKSWEHMGLKDSGHISDIWISPQDHDTVVVAVQGPLWNKGGDRGLYKTTDGGETWDRILEIDAHTGVNEIVVNPNDPDSMVVSTYQRRRHVWTLINGGPGSGIHRTTDGGKTWDDVTATVKGKNDLGRIGLAMAPSAPDTIYAIVEAEGEAKGVYRSTDFGASFEKRSGHMTTSPQYYNELVVDPKNPDRVYSLDTWTQVSEDGGKTWSRLSTKTRHVDDHALWIDPDNTAHLVIGGDGGIYESHDRGNSWRHVRNLPITQFYRVEPDNAEPFYNVCGGTQDNNSMCGPSRTTSVHGITNADWRLILGGDGYEPQIDPVDPNIIYAQYQYGGLARFDRRTGERTYIAPQPASGEKEFKFNWNTPLLISPHDRKTLYYGAEKLFRSTDMGSSWQAVSPDLTRQLDRNRLDVMGRVWSVDAVAKNDSTSMYGSLIAVEESTLEPGLLYTGSDDGVVGISEDGGETWRKVTDFDGVPDMTYVSDVFPSLHDPDVVYATMDNHKKGDYAPYVLRSDNRGKDWDLITGNLPERGSAHTIVQDHDDPDLLFVGTEFGLHFTRDGGETWHELTGNFPTIAVRDLEIQRRENDLVVGTFGRGIYILDDYRPLKADPKALASGDATLFPVKDALIYMKDDRVGGGEKGSQGDDFYTAENPPYGAVFTYYLPESRTTAKERRREAERKRAKEGGDNPYPSDETLRAEATEPAPEMVLTVRDADGAVVRRIIGPATKGVHRVAWDMRHPAPDKVELNAADRPSWLPDPVGPLATPGTYSVSMAVRRGGELTPMGDSRSFDLTPLDRGGLVTDDRAGLKAFQQKTAALSRALDGARGMIDDLDSRLKHLGKALTRTPEAGEASFKAHQGLRDRLTAIDRAVNGDSVIAGTNEPVPFSIRQRVQSIVFGHWYSQQPVTDLHRQAHDIARAELTGELARLEELSADLAAFEARMNAMGAPWTPGRSPELK
ncbi:glycosyl hydrolase [Yunchengibacter salinarum]|uniref:glycosyl hydrolase n=1 Tax=Yunchengibacter salinarum TaxID=3133399 RepID=UPI0035B5F529